MATAEYEKLRAKYRPAKIEWLFLTESPPPAGGSDHGTRHFYEFPRPENDRLFWNTMRALYKEARIAPESELSENKEKWLQRFANDCCYQVESLDESLPHGTKTSERHKRLQENMPVLIKKLTSLVQPKTKIILIKSTVYKICSEPLKEAGLNVINDDFIDYPGYWRERQFVEKLSSLIKNHGWPEA